VAGNGIEIGYEGCACFERGVWSLLFFGQMIWDVERRQERGDLMMRANQAEHSSSQAAVLTMIERHECK
jgi:hypothetical protein